MHRAAMSPRSAAAEILARPRRKTDEAAQVWESREQIFAREYPPSRFSKRSLLLLKECLDLDDESVRATLDKHEKLEKKKQQEVEIKLSDIEIQIKDLMPFSEENGMPIVQTETNALLVSLQNSHAELREVLQVLNQRRADRNRLRDELDLKKADAILSANEERKEQLRIEKSQRLIEKVTAQRKSRRVRDEIDRQKQDALLAEEEFHRHHQARKLLPFPPKSAYQATAGDVKPSPRPPNTTRSTSSDGMTPRRSVFPPTASSSEPKGYSQHALLQSTHSTPLMAPNHPMDREGDDSPDRVPMSPPKDSSRKLDYLSDPPASAERRKPRNVVSYYQLKKTPRLEPLPAEERLHLPALDLKLNDHEMTDKLEKQETVHKQMAERSSRRAKSSEQVWIMYQAAVSRRKQALEVLASDPPVEYILSDRLVSKYVPDYYLE
eukprot:TRINITY_DN1447_c0_g1_i6.p1 TRINITY_DN1447_c0_g1~~TRINITY_DN1447_c0_g1_i6.p1  ORF type:complete len:437 (+),score=78.22 TRINITY_DN1447_c0_g1_i6:78-1388(+)